jgi:hypothetical protein
VHSVHRAQGVILGGGGIVSRREKPGWVELLARVLRDTPKLTGALCPGRHHIFDAEQGDQAEREHAERCAVQLCRRCPCLAACSDLVDSQPPQRLRGVVAGRVFRGSQETGAA